MIERTRDLLQDANAGCELERAYGLEHALERAAIHPFGGVPQKMVGAAEAGRRAARVRRRGCTDRCGAAAAPGAGGGRGLSARIGRRRFRRVAAQHAGPRALGDVGEKTAGTAHYGTVKWPLSMEPPSCALLA